MDQLYFHPANPFFLSQKLVFAQQILCCTASLPHVDSAILVESWVLVWELNYPQQITGIFRTWRNFQQEIHTNPREVVGFRHFPLQNFRWIDKMQSFPKGALVFTSLPDMSEVVETLGPRFEDWEQFFMKAVRRAVHRPAPLNERNHNDWGFPLKWGYPPRARWLMENPSNKFWMDLGDPPCSEAST